MSTPEHRAFNHLNLLQYFLSHLVCYEKVNDYNYNYILHIITCSNFQT